jgi:hypothetical protein
LYRTIRVRGLRSQQLEQHENERMRLVEEFLVRPAHFFAEHGNELYFPLDYAA